MNHTNESTHTHTHTERNDQTTPPGEKPIHSENGDEKNLFVETECIVFYKKTKSILRVYIKFLPI